MKLPWLGACLLCLPLLAACGPGSSASPAVAPAADAAEFVARHWARPLPPQGPAPAHFTPAATSLAPTACAGCHPRQFADWGSAPHSRAMGPGLLGQLQEMGADAVEDHQACLECHAPLAEQAADLRRALAAANPAGFAPDVAGADHRDGLTCAGCHVRQRRTFGPPRADGSLPAPGTDLPHDGWIATPAFADSRFCAACHQFDASGPALNGKPLENTYEEWRASRHAREGRHCQSCHMPERRHLWRGIHDADMVRSGLAIAASEPAARDGVVAAELSIANVGVGHAFPTYVTPRVVVEIGQADRAGKPLAATVERHLIARDVSLDLATEHADTRLLPDESRRYAYRRPRDARAAALVFRIVVAPDDFYARFYRASLRDPDVRKGRAALREALRRAEASSYVLFESRRPLAGGGLSASRVASGEESR
ncbi:MAG: hypothetical protein HZC24_03905 [Rhodocyclales bacterium]|nr:hypothetical protein [Rhodocyclales bacterium]